MAGYWFRICFALLCTTITCGSVNTQIEELVYWPAILTLRLVNNSCRRFSIEPSLSKSSLSDTPPPSPSDPFWSKRFVKPPPPFLFHNQKLNERLYDIGRVLKYIRMDGHLTMKVMIISCDHQVFINLERNTMEWKGPLRFVFISQSDCSIRLSTQVEFYQYMLRFIFVILCFMYLKFLSTLANVVHTFMCFIFSYQGKWW